MFETRGVVTGNERIGAEGFWMEIRAPEIAAVTLPGQFVQLRCSDGLTPFTGRPFSVADVTEDRIAVAYIVVGVGTALMAEMVPGHEVPLVGPLGRPFSYEEPAERHVMIAGGIGSAPFPILSRTLAEVQPDAERIVLLGGRSKNHLYCRERFEVLGDRVLTATDDGSHGHHGFVTDLLDEFLDDPGVRMYACGPTPMFRTLDGRLAGHDTPCEISVEPIMPCGFGACYGCVVPIRDDADPEGYTYVKSCLAGPVFDVREILVGELMDH